MYGDCQARKQVKVSHNKAPVCTISHVLELLHMDLMGSMQVESLRGKRYALVCVDDFSCYTWVKFIREKSDTFHVYLTLCRQLQREQGIQIVCIQSDHGKEFENYQFEEFLTWMASCMNSLLRSLLNRMN